MHRTSTLTTTKKELKKGIKCTGKPLASRDNDSFYPTIYVDISDKGGPRMPKSLHVPDHSYPLFCNNPKGSSIFKQHVIKPQSFGEKFNPDQAAAAAAQWSSDAQPPSDKPWIASWWYPTDVFNPWPEKTNVKCWHCTYAFTWTPFPLPRSLEKSTGRYRVIGMFCGPSCAKAYATYSGKYFNLGNIMFWIDEIARNHFGYETVSGVPFNAPIAPQKELLQDYCGPKGLTIDQFRAICAYGRSVKLLDPMYITMKQVVQAEMEVALIRRKQYTSKSSAVVHLDNPDDTRSTAELVKVKRNVFGGRGARSLTEFLSVKK